jgi:hypothetical protein
MRLGYLEELLGGNAHEAGVCIIDKDKRERFGKQ